MKKIKQALKKVGETYKQDGKTFLYHLASVGVSTVAASRAAGAIDNLTELGDVANSALSTVVAAGTYWAPFIGMLALSERGEMKDESGKYSRNKIASNALQYGSFIGIGEVLYAGTRMTVQYQVQKRTNLDSATASVITDLGCAVAYGLLLPPVRSALRRIKLGRLEDRAG